VDNFPPDYQQFVQLFVATSFVEKLYILRLTIIYNCLT